MQLVPAETSLVVAGAWNPAILTPEWVLRHGLNRPAGQPEPIQVFVPAGSGLILDFPRYALPEFTFVVRPDTLIMTPGQQTFDHLDVLENAAAAMLEHLRHTPISGIGHNFEYRDADPSPDQLENFTRSRQDISDIMPEGWSAASTVVASAFKKADESVITTITRQFDAGTVSVKFNFHHPISNVEQALQILRGQNNFARMAANFEIARNLVTTLYGRQ
jgi:hypothetical protein